MPTIKDWNYGHDRVVVNYEDGSKATFEPYLHHGNVEGFKRFTLEKKSAVIIFEGRLGRYEFVSAITRIDGDITQPEAATYWRAAREFFDEKYQVGEDSRLWVAWIYCVGEGARYLRSLEENRASVKIEK